MRIKNIYTQAIQIQEWEVVKLAGCFPYLLDKIVIFTSIGFLFFPFIIKMFLKIIKLRQDILKVCHVTVIANKTQFKCNLAGSKYRLLLLNILRWYIFLFSDVEQ